MLAGYGALNQAQGSEFYAVAQPRYIRCFIVVANNNAVGNEYAANNVGAAGKYNPLPDGTQRPACTFRCDVLLCNQKNCIFLARHADATDGGRRHIEIRRSQNGQR
jgi:hypothetical protein